MRIQGLPQTRSVPTYTLALAVRLDDVPDDDTIDALGATLLPGADDLMVWRDAEPAVLRLSVDHPATDADAAVVFGLELGDHALALSRSGGAVEEVVAMDDERQVVWRATP
jgi:hypothetical protein